MNVRGSWHRELPLPRGERVGVRGFGSPSFCSEVRTPSTCPSPLWGEGTQRAGHVAPLSSRARSHSEKTRAQRRAARTEALAMKVCRSWRKELPLPRGERVGVRGFGSPSFCSEVRTPSTCPSPLWGEGTQRAGHVAPLSSRARSHSEKTRAQRHAARTEALAMKVCRSWRKELLPLPRGERVGVRGFGRFRFISDVRAPSSCPSPLWGEGTQRAGRALIERRACFTFSAGRCI